jgi:hypothetical protein
MEERRPGGNGGGSEAETETEETRVTRLPARAANAYAFLRADVLRHRQADVEAVTSVPYPARGRGAMSAWIILGCGCFGVVIGVLTLVGQGIAPHTRSPLAGWGRTAMGGGFVLEGGARLLDASSGAGLAVSTVALGLVLLGAALQARGGLFTRARRTVDGD